ncbi:MAG: ABC transporter ATP-binding protein [Clostridiales bacterium]|mgnify:CR=1 FL=1|nr:ABC transporter ATP-binding protein [Clostridiales bacterium]HBM80897.1 ABC transporter ATP-binding protein [Clostridiaceae bacterium]
MIKKWIVDEFIKKNIIQYILGIIAVITSSLLALTIPKVLGYIIDFLRNKSASQSKIAWVTLGMLGISAALFISKFLMRYFIMGKARDLECFLRAKLFEHLQKMPPKFFNQRKTGDLMAYATNDLTAIRQAFAFGLVFLIDGIIINLTSFFVMVKTIDPILTLISMGPVLTALVLIIKLRKKMRQRFTEVQRSFARMSDKIEENISGIRVIKAYVQENQEIDKINDECKHRMDVQLSYVRLSGLLGPVVQICFGISFALVLIMGSRFVRMNRISLGDFVAFNTYLTLLMGPVSNVGKIVEVWQKAAASMKRLDDIFVIKSDINDDEANFKSDTLKGEIKIKDFSFSYPGSRKRALKDINIHVKPGQTLAIVGRTGSGKSTLVNLLLRLFKVDRGHIFIDGADINDIPLSTLRENIGYVPQDNFLFSAAIDDNISFFRENAYKRSEIEDAAKMSDVYDNIMSFPEAFNTIVGERGATLSGGQKQRVSIARAIIKMPSILILDDSLSAVDTKTEEVILTNIKEILKGRTGIIISHRISAIKNADIIIFMENGMIAERGTHQELLDLKGRYYKLYRAQMAEKNIKQMEEAAI